MVDPTLTVAIVTMGGLGLFFAVILVVADRFLRVDENPLLVNIMEILPEANCGACGAAGCHDFANKLLENKMAISGCPIGGQVVADKLANLLQVEGVKKERIVARLMCAGGDAEAGRKPVDYFGPESCQAQAIISGGRKLCFYGCLGGGDCVSACRLGAITLNGRGLPEINTLVCSGCGLCVQVCPRGVLELHPLAREVFVFCKNLDQPQTARQVCAAACIGCGICARASDGAIVVQDNLAVIDYQRLKPDQIPYQRCKTQAIRKVRETQ